MSKSIEILRQARDQAQVEADDLRFQLLEVRTRLKSYKARYRAAVKVLKHARAAHRAAVEEQAVR